MIELTTGCAVPSAFHDTAVVSRGASPDGSLLVARFADTHRDPEAGDGCLPFGEGDRQDAVGEPSGGLGGVRRLREADGPRRLSVGTLDEVVPG